MPRRRKSEAAAETAAQYAGPSEVGSMGAVCGLSCWRESLNLLYKGNPPFVCHCPGCTPHLWCALAVGDGHPCWKPRWLRGDGIGYPFCRLHYMHIVGTYPPPSNELVSGLREWTRAIDTRGKLPRQPVPLYSPEGMRELWEARLRNPDDTAFTPRINAKARHEVRRALGNGEL